MVDANIKKVTVPASTLPALWLDSTTSAPYHYIRYRITSDDKNKLSAWSAPVKVFSRYTSTMISGTTISPNIVSDGTTIAITWNVPTVLFGRSFDVYYSYNTAINSTAPSAPTTYAGTTPTGAFSMRIPTGATNIRFRVQLETQPKIINDNVKLFETTGDVKNNTTRSLTNGGLLNANGVFI